MDVIKQINFKPSKQLLFKMSNISKDNKENHKNKNFNLLLYSHSVVKIEKKALPYIVQT